MANERLRAAMEKAHVSIAELATYTEKDAKTVGRWLGGRVPHPRNRFLIAKRLKEDEEFLWPGASYKKPDATAGAEIIASYPYRAETPVSDWWKIITQANRQIDLLGYTLYFLPMQHPQLITTLKEKCEGGCKVRAAIGEPGSGYVVDRDNEEQLAMTLSVRILTSLKYFRPLLECDNFELRFQNIPLYNSIFRFDDEMFVTPHLYATTGAEAPLLHLRRLGPNGIFSRFASHFERVWAEKTRDLSPSDWDRDGSI
jgi:transcriptional regulator with XRE-family HTH domain